MLNDLFIDFLRDRVYEKYIFCPTDQGFATNASWTDVKNNLKEFQYLSAEQHQPIICSEGAPVLKGTAFKIVRFIVYPDNIVIHVKSTEKIKKLEKSLHKLDVNLRLILGIKNISVILDGEE